MKYDVGNLMGSGNKAFTSKGYRWRDELVNELLPYVKDEIGRGFPNKREFLNNLVRGYVPSFFPTRIPTNNKGATWLVPLYLRPNRHWWKKEIEDIGKEFAEESGRLNDKSAKEIFKNHNWEVDKPVEGISLLDKRGRWKYGISTFLEMFKLTSLESPMFFLAKVMKCVYLILL